MLVSPPESVFDFALEANILLEEEGVVENAPSEGQVNCNEYFIQTEGYHRYPLMLSALVQS